MNWTERVKEGQQQGLFVSFQATEDEGEFVIGKNNPNCVDPSYTGGKGSSLAVLSVVKDINVPDFFVVTTKAFQNSLANSLEFSNTLQIKDSAEHAQIIECRQLYHPTERKPLYDQTRP